MGDKYMAVSGLPEPCEDHVRCIARLALDMMDLSHTVVVDGVPVVSVHRRRRKAKKKSFFFFFLKKNKNKNIFVKNGNFIFEISSAHNDWHTQRRGGDRSDRSQDATVLFVREHGESDKQDRNHWHTGKNQRLGKCVQVRT